MKRRAGADGIAESEEMQLSYALRETSRLLLGVLRKALEPHDITLTQYFLLRQIWNAEGISQSELSERLGTTQPATVATVDALEARGLLVRVRATNDRRVVRLMITPQGRKMRTTLLDYAQQKSEAALIGLTPADVRKLQALLEHVQANLAYELREPNARERGA